MEHKKNHICHDNVFVFHKGDIYDFPSESTAWSPCKIQITFLTFKFHELKPIETND